MKQGARFLATLILAISGLFTLLGFLAGYAFLFDTIVQFRLQYALAAGLAWLIFGLLRNLMLSLLAAVILAVNLFFIFPYYLSDDLSSGPTALGPVLWVMSLNVLSSNADAAAVQAEIDRLQPDVVALQEITPRWFAALADLSTNYPYQVHAVREDNFGIWLLSKCPIADEEIIPWGPAQLPTATFRYPVEEQFVRVIAMHPMSPADPEGVRWRNEQLRQIATRYEASNDALIIVGDLNTTSFSPIFGEFAQQLNVKDSRQGFGLQCSWPAWGMRPLMITLDHCLVSKGARVIRRQVGNYVGSDHLPIFVEVALPR